MRSKRTAYLTKDVLHEELLKAIRTVYSGIFPIYRKASAATLAAQWPRPELSGRELEVLTLIVKGMANKEIAATLHIANIWSRTT